MDHAELDVRERPDVLDRVRQSLQPITAGNQDTLDAAVLQLCQPRHPGLGALAAGAYPHAQHVTLAFEIDPHGDVDRPVGDRTVADLQHDRVDHHHRVDTVERPLPPGVQLLGDLVGRAGDQVAGDVHVVDLREMSLDLTRRQTLRIQRQDRLVETLHPAGVLGHDGRTEGAGPVPGNVDLHRADVSQDRLRDVPLRELPDPAPALSPFS